MTNPSRVAVLDEIFRNFKQEKRNIANFVMNLFFHAREIRVREIRKEIVIVKHGIFMRYFSSHEFLNDDIKRVL